MKLIIGADGSKVNASGPEADFFYEMADFLGEFLP